jgi:hypothetical protein
LASSSHSHPNGASLLLLSLPLAVPGIGGAVATMFFRVVATPGDAALELGGEKAPTEEMPFPETARNTAKVAR